MPSRQSVEAFVADVMSEDHVGAIERWYAPDASMQENQGEPRVGRQTLMDHEAKALAPPLVDGETVVIRWRFTFTSKQGVDRAMEEVAWQTWKGDKIWRETFFYDPAQMAG